MKSGSENLGWRKQEIHARKVRASVRGQHARNRRRVSYHRGRSLRPRNIELLHLKSINPET